MKICEHCHGRGVIPESPCETCESGSSSWVLVNDGIDWKTGKKKTHVEHTDCRDTCINYRMHVEHQRNKLRNKDKTKVN